MAGTIAKTSIGITANATEAISELERVGKTTKALEKNISTMPGTALKVTAAFAQIGSVSNVFAVMESDASDATKAVAAVSGAVGVLTVALQLALTVTKGMKAALLATGIGAVIVGLGWLVSRLASAGSIASDSGRATRERAARELSLFDRARTGFGDATGGLSPGDRIIRDSIEGPVAPFPHRRGVASVATARETTTGTSRLVELEAARTRARDLTETMGLGSEAADDYALSLRRTITTIGGVAVATTESLSPIAAHTRRMMELSVLSGRPLIDVTAARVESLEMMRREITALDEVGRARLRAAGAAETTRLRSPDESRAIEIERMSSLFRRGATDAATFARGMASLVEVPTTPLEATRARIEGIRAAFGALVSESPEWPEPTPFIRSLESVAGDTRTPIERTRDRITEIGEAWEEAGAMALTNGEEFDDTSFRRATARALTDLERSGSLEMSAPQALLEGSAAAISAINAARRSGSDDPAERTVRAIDTLRRVDEATERNTAAMLRLLSAGIIRL